MSLDFIRRGSSELTPLSTDVERVITSRQYQLESYFEPSNRKLGDNDHYFGRFDMIKIPLDSNDQFHIIGPGEKWRLDLISYKYYKTPLYNWAIAVANGIYDMVKEVEPGLTLRIPYLPNIVRALKSQRR